MLFIQGKVAEIRLMRAEMANKLQPEDLHTIRQHLDAINQCEAVEVLILRGEGKYFCSGYDISDIQNSQHEGSSCGEMVDAIEQCRPITIAALHGGVYGGATDMALACDFRLGSSRTEMFMPAARLGLHFYKQGLERYVTRLGLDTAKRLFLTCERLDAQAMKDCGFLTHLAAEDAFEQSLQTLTIALCQMAPLPLLGMKKHLNLIARQQHNAQDIAQAVLQTIHSHDLQEGSRAWKEKRPAAFIGS